MLYEEELRDIAPVEVFPNGEELFDRMNELVYRFDTSTKESCELHADCDLRLVQKMHNVLIPIFGEPGSKDNRWFHEMDWYGDGVRLVEAEWNTVSLSLVKTLHDLLSGEHHNFCIAWKAYADLKHPEGEKAAVAIFANKILVMESLLVQRQHA